ncbi:LLM class flavin-dependent oxidoreductase [Pseudoduganella namucuonensis]|uniref:Flavin-dependent oxidoreductase, luciferase family (Includes alkanesulfonate monooxygenase SsuD and methylene tetrahydromethanopterin reductase) n=1 Tax=Pseudoduganella namucuonensis TaxID=1035707 RepID=A0A1I7KYX3_9BURK|nr:LLM class flavin-dependent oxidoreductase [Pseudoduganella namucuonensis]SFV02712.1 Flavin-dependent oxidoreductase, luciferase family (includes alkanesulfonate monooxygenase SsuD and methylene tetrahydromethanopterin reductase) [Pseudoduganella namucuonensis]
MKTGFFHTPYILPKRTARQVFDWSMELAMLTDEAGYADFMIGEHYTLAWENIPCPEIIIGAAARLTKRIRFAPMAHLLPYHNPATLATQVGWLSQVLEGRYFLGVAPGGHHTDAILHGHDNIGELQAKMFEALELMERVWQRQPFKERTAHFQAGYPGPADFPGYEIDYADNSPWGGRDKLEIAVTGLTKNSSSLKWAGERNYSPISFFGGTEVMKSHWDTWAAAAASKGHAADRSRFRVTRDIFIADSDAEARRLAMNSGLADSWREYLGPIYKKFNLFQGIIEDSGTDIDPSQVDMEFLAEHVWLCGSPETVRRKLELMAEKTGGWGEIIVNSHDNIDNPKPYFESLQRLAKEVTPKLHVL